MRSNICNWSKSLHNNLNGIQKRQRKIEEICISEIALGKMPLKHMALQQKTDVNNDCCQE